MSSNWNEPIPPAPRPATKNKAEVVYVRKVMNGYLLDVVGRNQLFVVQGDGSPNDIEEMLKAVRFLFEE